MSEILNSTVYETSDIEKIVKSVHEALTSAGEARTTSQEIAKIRYLNATRRIWGWRNKDIPDSFAQVIHGGRYGMEICILRPSKLEINALVALAHAATGDDKNYPAPEKVTIDVITCIYGRLAQSRGRTQRMSMNEFKARKAALIKQIAATHSICINPTAKGRKAYALANLKKRIVSKQNGIANIEYQISQAEVNLQYYKDKLPGSQAALKKLVDSYAAKEKANAKADK